MFYLIAFIGLIGHVFRLYDKYVARGVGAVQGLEAREILLESATSNLGLVGAVLYPFGYIPIFILLGARCMPRSRLRLMAATGLFLIPAVDALLLLSRSYMLISLGMAYFGASLALFRGRLAPAPLFLPMSMGVLGVVALSIFIFSIRLSEMQFDIVDSVIMSAYGFTVRPSETALSVMGGGGLLGGVLAGVIPLVQYFTHSMMEFQILWLEGYPQNFTLGALHFAPYHKLLAMLDIAAPLDLSLAFPRVGVFTSFFGPLWADFSWLGIFVMFLFGAVCGALASSVRANDIGAYPLYVYFVVVLFFSPVVSFIVSAQGMYAVNAFFIFWLLSRGLARLRPLWL